MNTYFPFWGASGNFSSSIYTPPVGPSQHPATVAADRDRDAARSLFPPRRRPPGAPGQCPTARSWPRTRPVVPRSERRSRTAQFRRTAPRATEKRQVPKRARAEHVGAHMVWMTSGARADKSVEVSLGRLFGGAVLLTDVFRGEQQD